MQPLSPKEIEVLHHISYGLQLEKVAERIGISREGVLFRLREAKKKTGAKTTSHLVAFAIRTGQME